MKRIGEILDAPPQEGGSDAAPEAMVDAGQRCPSPSASSEWRDGAAASLAAWRGDLEFRDLSFAHEGREPALRGVTLRVPAGSMVAVVGPTGAGKSTLAALAIRLFEPPRSTVFLDGVDVREIPLTLLRRLVAYVPQEPFLFSRSLRENLRLADESADDERLTAVAAMAGLSAELSALPERLDTRVGERGITLSGGQRARVTLARALLSDPPVLILDDPFAAVDSDTEGEVLARLRAARAGRTTVVITHRLRAAAEADRVVALEDGRVAEEGTHASLISGDGVYARLWRVQQIEDELERSQP
jgi:ATP-binding cassette subfamily B protein